MKTANASGSSPSLSSPPQSFGLEDFARGLFSSSSLDGNDYGIFIKLEEDEDFAAIDASHEQSCNPSPSNRLIVSPVASQVMGTSSCPAFPRSSKKSTSSSEDESLESSTEKEINTGENRLLLSTESTPDASGSGSASANEVEVDTASTVVLEDNEPSVVSASIAASVEAISISDPQEQMAVVPSWNNNSRQASSTHPARPIRQNHQRYPNRNFQRGHWFNSRGGNNGHGFQNQTYSNRRQHSHGFNDRYSNQRFNDASAVNSWNHPNGFINPVRFLGPSPPPPPPLLHSHPYSTFTANPPPGVNAPFNPPPGINAPFMSRPPPPPLPHPSYMRPPVFGNYGDSFFPESISNIEVFRGTAFHPQPVQEPVSNMEVFRGATFHPQPAQEPVSNMEVFRGAIFHPQPAQEPVSNMQVFRGAAFRPQRPLLNNFPNPEVELCNALRKQIEYYFCDDNMVKDYFLRTNMDENGWVSIHLVAGFNKVKSMTSDVDLVRRALWSSRTIEVQGDRIRRRGDWMKWIICSSSRTQSPASSSRTQSPAAEVATPDSNPSPEFHASNEPTIGTPTGS